MHLVPKRLLLAGAAPLAIAAVYGGSLAFAQSGEQTPTPDDGTPTQDATPTTPDGNGSPETPGDDGTPRGEKDCPRGSGGSGSDSEEGSGSADPTQLRTRSQRGGSALY